MEPEIKDVPPASSTGADENTSAASSATETAEPASLKAQLDKRLSEVRKANEKPTADGKTADPVTGDKKASDAKPGDKADDKKAKGEDEKPIPLPAFKARLAKEAEKRKAIQDKLDTSDVENKRLKAALDIVADELKREREARTKGVARDPKDEQIRSFEVAQRAQQEATRIDTETKQAREAAVHEAQIDDATVQLSAEIADAVGDESVISRDDLIGELRKPQNALRSPKEVAEEKIAIRLEAMKKRLVKDRPAFPSTVRSKAGGNHSARVEPTRNFLNERLAQIRAQQPSG